MHFDDVVELHCQGLNYAIRLRMLLHCNNLKSLCYESNTTKDEHIVGYVLELLI